MRLVLFVANIPFCSLSRLWRLLLGLGQPEAGVGGEAHGAAEVGGRVGVGGQHIKPELDAALAAALVDDDVDFGRLDELRQEQVLRHLAVHAEARVHVRPTSALRPVSPETLARNRRVVGECYSEEKYAHRLLDLYRRVISGTSGDQASALNAADLLDQFLDPAHFHLLRT